MKQITLLVVAVLSLTFFSFQGSQERKLVRLKDGTYQVSQVDLKPETLKELMTYKGWKEAKQVQPTKEFDFSEFRDSKGWKETAALHETGRTLVIHKEAKSKAFTKTLYKTKNVRVQNEAEARGFIDRTMESYLR